MNWLNLEMSVLENEAFGAAETAVLGTWVRLMRYCCVQENGGRIPGAKTWEPRKCVHLLRLEPAEMQQKSELWTWKGDDLVVLYFPEKNFAKVKRLRALGKKAAESRWRKPHTSSSAPSIPPAVPPAIPNGTPSGLPSAMRNSNSKGKSKDKDKSKGKSKGKGSVPVGTDGPKPHALAEVISFFGSQSAPPELASKFFRHYNASGWRLGNGNPVASWQSSAEKWIGDWKEDVAKKSATGGAGVEPFDASQPHAHTGGVEVAN